MKNQRSLVPLSIVTISYSFDDSLTTTLRSIFFQRVLPSQVILVVSSPCSAEPEIISDLSSVTHVSRIFSQDKSIYNAMNIGLSNVNSDYVLFLNSGDYFASDFSLSIFEHDLDTTTSPVSCFSYSALNTYDSSDAFIRYPWSVSLPCHQSFIAPHDPLFPLIFDESKRLSADCDWIKRNILMFSKINYLLSK